MKPSRIEELEEENNKLKKQVEQLSFHKDKYQKLFEVSADALSIIDLSTGKFIECNQSAIYMHGVESEKNFLNLKPSDISPELQPCGGSSEDMAMERITKTVSEGPQIFQWQHSRLDGSTFPCLVSLTAIPFGDVPLILAIGRDISELTETQRKLENAQKVALAGQLSAGICHDLNNVLNIISGNAELLQYCDEQQDIRNFAMRIEQGIARAKSVTDRLLKLAKPSINDITTFYLDDVIKDELQFYKDAVSSHIQFESSLASNAFIGVDINNFTDSIINLVINAQKAIKDSGTISLETSRTSHFDFDLDFTFSVPQKAREYACVVVRDTGAGIAKELLEKIFNPFFSGEQDQQGTGLGLSVVSAFAVNNQCGLTVNSVVNQGTEFCIWIPVIDDATHQDKPSADVQQGSLIGSNVMIVEDEEELLDIFAISLENAGAVVTKFTDPEQAKKYISAHSTSIDILQTDQSLGVEMKGSDLIAWTDSHFPNITTVLLTGYSSDESLSGLNTMIVEKPISIGELLKSIVKAKDARQQG